MGLKEEKAKKGKDSNPQPLDHEAFATAVLQLPPRLLSEWQFPDRETQR